MKKLTMAGLILLAACKTQTTEEVMRTPSPVNGAPAAPMPMGPRPALDAFLGAIKAGDLQAFAAAWGDKEGPVRDSKRFSREEMEQRTIVLMRCFKFDSYRILGESAAANSERVVQTELTRGTTKKVVDFFTVQGPGRWYVRYANTSDLCTAS